MTGGTLKAAQQSSVASRVKWFHWCTLGTLSEVEPRFRTQHTCLLLLKFFFFFCRCICVVTCFRTRCVGKECLVLHENCSTARSDVFHLTGKLQWKHSRFPCNTVVTVVYIWCPQVCVGNRLSSKAAHLFTVSWINSFIFQNNSQGALEADCDKVSSQIVVFWASG